MKQIQKNSREVIRVEESEYEGHKFVDCRIYFDDNGEWKPKHSLDGYMKRLMNK